MASVIYDSFTDDVCRGNIVPSSDTFWGLLVTSSYTPNKGTHTKRSDLTNEVVGTGYTADGQVVALTLAKDTSGHKETLSFADNVWTTATISAAAEVIYKRRGGLASADNLVCYVDFGGTVSSTAGTFTAQCTSALTYQN